MSFTVCQLISIYIETSNQQKSSIKDHDDDSHDRIQRDDIFTEDHIITSVLLSYVLFHHT